MRQPIIVICGKNKICADSIQAICNALSNSKIVYVYAEGDTAAARDCIAISNLFNIDTYSVSCSDDFSDLYNKISPTLLISIQFSIIVPNDVIARGRGRLLNLHFSPLPLFRGMAPITHAILSGETRFGVSLHEIDYGIDTGPVIDQELFDIVQKNNREVYTLCEIAGLKIIERSVDALRKISDQTTELFISSPQDDNIATYYNRGDVDYKNTNLDFNRTATHVERQSRAFLFPPTLYPKISIGAISLKVLTPPVIGERCIEHRPNIIFETSPLTITSRDRFLIFNDVSQWS